MINLRVFLVFSCLALTGFPQTGGMYDVSHNVIASGGGSSTGGIYLIEGTIGQGVAGTRSSGTTPNGNPVSLRGGFWAFESLAPTAADVTVSGRILTSEGRGIPHVIVTLTGMDGVSRSTRSTAFGYYRFEDVTVGTYLLAATSRRRNLVFVDPIRVIDVNDAISDADFIAQPF